MSYCNQFILVLFWNLNPSAHVSYWTLLWKVVISHFQKVAFEMVSLYPWPCGLCSCRHCHEPTLVAKWNLYFPSVFIDLPRVRMVVRIEIGLKTCCYIWKPDMGHVNCAFHHCFFCVPELSIYIWSSHKNIPVLQFFHERRGQFRI